MRLWSLHPAILDRAALVAVWREALLAQKVLAGETRGYTRHPQLERFRAQPRPLESVGAYLSGVRDEALARGYRFDALRIRAAGDPAALPPIPVTRGQLALELEHLRAKCVERAPDWLDRLPAPGVPPRPHPLFAAVDGDIEPWERAAPGEVSRAASRRG